ncbi:acyl-CoA dehydrogenase [Williamsia sp. Leaf354]|uniref:acyl-CoA dehydrogenase family protein n=1 Tax=Williamsia sp. Leaf354 TaxID=1736349 RepID=UPI000701105D|nr:acyl-CoA dehydrogenase family protein [Williamsia sp. Leaf354]KQS00432.1 acyl-CoA dehydrogenase [Williamsia sp. Leaf354]
MDFTVDSTATAVGDVVSDLLRRHTPVWDAEFVDPGGFDTDLYASVHRAGLLALALPADHGGDDVGLIGLHPLLRALGTAAAVTPTLGTVVAGAVASGPGAASVVAGIVEGGGHVAVAVSEPGSPLTTTPQTSLSNGRLRGTKTAVLHAGGSAALLVTTDSGAVLVDTDAPGVTLTATPSSTGWGEYTVRFDDVAVPDDRVVARDARVVRDAHRFALSAYADGVLAGALRITADHVTNRVQFGKPIATFQAVTQQLADIYVVGRSMNLAVTSAVWRMSEGLDADRDLSIAAYWLAAEMPSTLRTMTHLHGGVGVDITYPLHRYASIVKDLARLVGGPTARLDELAESSMLAAELAESVEEGI